MATEASFVFEGTVTALGQSTEPLVPPGDLTAVVRVETVLRAPEAMRTITGRDITVQLRQPAKVGDRARFATRGLLYSASLAVEEVAARKAAAAERAAPAAVRAGGEREASPREADQAQRLRSGLKERAAAAGSIVLGQVVSVSGPEQPAAAATRGARTGRLSEHDPQWSTATVLVDSVLKGRAAKSVKVVFANSQDVMWYRAPKLAVGQRAVLMLRKGVPEAPSKSAQVVLDELDVQSAERAALVTSLL